MIFRVDLPLPPSANGAYGNRKPTARSPRGGRYPTKAHRVWKLEAGWLVLVAKPPRLHGPYRFSIELPMGMRGDCSNRIKLAEDLLVELGVTPDDRKAISAHAERKEHVPKGRCFVEVRSVEAA